MSGEKTLIRDFTRGPLLKQLALFSLPFMCSNALQVLYSLADMLIVGRFLGSQSLAAVAIASQFSLFMTMLCLGFSNGGQIYISQLIGSGDRSRLNSAIGTLFTTVLSAGVIVSVAGVLAATPALKVLQTPPESFAGAREYLIVCSAGMIFSYGYNMVSAVLRGMGDSRHPFLFVLIASVLNVILDLLFICVFRWGIFGAALATVLGQALSFLYSLVFLWKRKEMFGFDFRLASFRVDRKILKVLLELGIPFAIRFAAIIISMMFVNALVNGLGYQASATFGVGIRLDDLVTKVSQGVMLAASAMIGQNFGAGNFRRIRKIVVYAWLLSVGLYIVYTILLVSFPEPMYGFFTDDAEVRHLAPVFVSAIIWHYPALVLMRGTNALIHGVGNAWLGLIYAIFDGFVLRILCSWLLGIYFGMGLFGFILGYALATYGTALPGLFYFLFWPWYKRRRVTD